MRFTIWLYSCFCAQHSSRVKAEADAKANLEAQYHNIKQRKLMAEATGEQDQFAGTDDGTAWMYAGHTLDDGGGATESVEKKQTEEEAFLARFQSAVDSKDKPPVRPA